MNTKLNTLIISSKIHFNKDILKNKIKKKNITYFILQFTPF